jgi:hypothetical protein
MYQASNELEVRFTLRSRKPRIVDSEHGVDRLADPPLAGKVLREEDSKPERIVCVCVSQCADLCPIILNKR